MNILRIFSGMEEKVGDAQQDTSKKMSQIISRLYMRQRYECVWRKECEFIKKLYGVTFSHTAARDGQLDT